MQRKIYIPSLEEINKAIIEFEQEDWSNNDISKVEKYVSKLDRYFISKFGFILKTLRASNTNNLPNKVFRLRKHESGINTSLITEFSHPPVYKTSIQRANLPSHPIFYCAPSASTALFEMLQLTYKENEDNSYYLSEWVFLQDLPVYVSLFIYGEYERVDLYNSWSEKSFSDLRKKLPELTDDESVRLRSILSYFSKLFEKNENHYLSSYLGHIHFYDKTNIRTDVMIYPSIQTDKSSLNFAIHPNAVFHKMRLNRIFSFKVKSYKADFNKTGVRASFEFGIEDRLGINNEHGYLAWRNLPNEDLNDFKKLFPEASLFPH